LSIQGEIREEFFQIGEEIKTALKTLFQPDKMNYAALSNISPKIHVHIVHRYNDPRDFSGSIFQDTRWGKNYAPYDKAFKIEEKTLFKIKRGYEKNLRQSGKEK
jgi:diadenosine tetraphosphate (Ap4A) HIT family hydrolase